MLGEGPAGNDPGEGGRLIFLDALPLEWPAFEIDVITRHHDPEALAKQKVPLRAALVWPRRSAPWEEIL